MKKAPADINIGPNALVGEAVEEFLENNPDCPGMIAKALAQLAENMDEGGHTLAAYSQASKQFQALSKEARELCTPQGGADDMDEELAAIDAELESM